jgi:integrase
LPRKFGLLIVARSAKQGDSCRHGSCGSTEPVPRRVQAERQCNVWSRHPHSHRSAPAQATYASEMVRAGVGLPALMKLLGHVNPEMTMRYVDVAGTDLQREFHWPDRNPGIWRPNRKP